MSAAEGREMHRCYRQEKRKKEESGMKIAIPLDENKKGCLRIIRQSTLFYGV